MRNPFTKQNRLGFTLAEVLAVIGVIVILLALGVPGFLGLRKNIQITEYDDIAREIYIAAQNELTRLSVGGMDTDTAKTLSDNEYKLSSQPSDYAETDTLTWTNDADNYRYATNDSDIAELLLPFGSVTDDARSGYYVIEYNTKTYIVYGVFYSEKEFDYTADGGMDDLRTDKTTRRNHSPMIGYYGGSAVERDEQNHCATPVLTIENDDVLQLTISAKNDSVINYTVYVTISDGDNHTVTLNSMDNPTLLQTTDGWAYTLLMDSLTGDKFKDIFSDADGRYLTPGADLDITVTFMSDDALPSSATAQTNSLFATREDDNTVTIAYARHLQNLDSNWSKVTSEITAARQTEDIDWSKVVKADGTTVRDFDFTSITNANLTSYDGNYQEIQNLTGENGLFKETAANTQLANIRVVNPTITANNNDNPVGGLVGTAENTTVTNCGVYWYSLNTDGSGTINFSAYKGKGITAVAATAGGLIGSATGCTVTSSFAALPMISAQSGAGLIGSASGCIITSSYSNCDNLTQGLNYFVGGGGSNTITHCYAVGNVENEASSKTFASTSDTVTDSYYAVSHHTVNNDGSLNDLAATEFAAITTGSWTTTDYDDLTKWTGSGDTTWCVTNAACSHPYLEMLDGRAYPFPFVNDSLDHYGSWPTGDGTVTLTVNLAYLAGSGEGDATAAGKVTITDGSGNTVYDSDDTTAYPTNSVAVKPGAALTITVTDKTGYQYVTATLTAADGTSTSYTNDDETKTERTFDYTIQKDTELTVTFKRSVYILTCKQGENEKSQAISGSSYSVTTSAGVVTVSSDTPTSVSAGSAITVRIPSMPTNYTHVGAVWCELSGGTKVYATLDDETGYYTFDMPSADATLHVQFSNQKANYKFEFYVMDTGGNYPAAATRTLEREYGIGQVISQALIDSLTASSNQTLTVNGVDVLYPATDEEHQTTITRSDSSDTYKIGYTTTSDDKDKTFTIKIYIRRASFTLTLAAGENITGVGFDGDTSNKTIGATYYYGQSVTASAAVASGQSFTYWDVSDSRSFKSSDTKYTFKMPYYDLTLTAQALSNQRLVTLYLRENGEDWLESSDSRQADPITVTLVSSVDGTEYPMTAPEDDDYSYMVQAVVPVISAENQGYYIRVHYETSGLTEYYTEGGKYYAAYDSDTLMGVQTKNTDGTVTSPQTDDRVIVRVRSRAVEDYVNFYTITYYPTKEYTTGSVPPGGTYMEYHVMTVPGNTYMLRNADTTDTEKYFIGWRDDQNTDGTLYCNTPFILTRRTDFMAQWSGGIQVIYDANADDAEGELPTDNTDKSSTTAYKTGDSVTVKFTNITRTGYTFKGWSTDASWSGDSSKTLYTADGTTSFTIVASNPGSAQETFTNEKITLYAIWEPNIYTITYYDTDSTLLPSLTTLYTYGDSQTVKAYPDDKLTSGDTFLGWSLTAGGSIDYAVGDSITVAEDTALYARTTATTVTITYKSMDGGTIYGTSYVGKGVAVYLYNEAANEAANKADRTINGVTAWSTKENGKGELYLCDDNGKSLEQIAFADNTTLYAVTGKVYNYNRQEWYNTLYAAVVTGETVSGSTTTPAAEDTLIVYRSTEEDHRIEFTEDLYIIASGDRTVTWAEDAIAYTYTITMGGGGNRPERPPQSQQTTTVAVRLNEQKSGANRSGSLNVNDSGEFVGCMNVYQCTVYFGYTEEPGLSMDGSTLTFDANKQSRVVSIGGTTYDANNQSVLHMYDGVTLTNGDRTKAGVTKDSNGNKKANRIGYGGGVYAANGGTFYMHGGTVSYCSAVAGGGVYLLGTGPNSDEYKNNITYEMAKMVMGDMVHPTAWSSTAIYYYLVDDGYYYVTPDEVTPENYTDYYVASGDARICYCTSTQTSGDGGGGLLMLDVDSTGLQLFHGSIDHNSTTANGGGIMTDAAYNDGEKLNDGTIRDQKLRIYEVDISHNTASGNGGGIFQWQGTLYIYNSTIRQNSAANGGGVFLASQWNDTTSVEFYYGEIAYNTATGDGGGICIQAYIGNANNTTKRQVKMTGGALYGNTANGYGGGVYVGYREDKNGKWVGGELILSGGSITDNTHAKNVQNNGDYVFVNNDVYLSTRNGNRTYITVPTGATLALEQTTPIVVDCDDPAAGRTIVYYEAGSTFNSSDADWFSYLDDTWYVVPTTGTDGSYIAPLILSASAEGNRTVVLDYNNGTGTKESYSYSVGTTIALPMTLNGESGYYLAGWATTEEADEEDYIARYNTLTETWQVKDSGGSWVDTDQPAYTVTSAFSQTLYAMWSRYVVNYDLNLPVGATAEDASMTTDRVENPSALIGPNNSNITVNGITYKFLGWSETEGGTTADYTVGQTITLTKNLRLYGVWQAQTVTITYELSGGSGTPQTQTANIGEEVTLLGSIYTRSKYVLVGWETSDRTTSYGLGDTITASESMTLYAVWAGTVTITYYPNGGMGSAVESTVQQGASCKLLAASGVSFTKDGRELLGWATSANGGVEYALGAELSADEVTDDINLYAVWGPLLTYDANNGTESTSTAAIYRGQSCTLASADIFTNDGYMLTEWNTKSDGSGTSYMPGQTVDAGTFTADTTLYAIWKSATGDGTTTGGNNGETNNDNVNAASLTEDAVETTPTPTDTPAPTATPTPVPSVNLEEASGETEEASGETEEASGEASDEASDEESDEESEMTPVAGDSGVSAASLLDDDVMTPNPAPCPCPCPSPSPTMTPTVEPAAVLTPVPSTEKTEEEDE